MGLIETWVVCVAMAREQYRAYEPHSSPMKGVRVKSERKDLYGDRCMFQ